MAQMAAPLRNGEVWTAEARPEFPNDEGSGPPGAGESSPMTGMWGIQAGALARDSACRCANAQVWTMGEMPGEPVAEWPTAFAVASSKWTGSACPPAGTRAGPLSLGRPALGAERGGIVSMAS